MRRLFLFLAAGGLLLTACSSSISAPTLPANPPAERPTTTTSLPVIEAEAIDWQDPSIVAESGGWTFHACEGGAPMLCVERDGETIGVVEAMAYPIASFDGTDPSGPAADNLHVLATGFVEAFEMDRASGCGDGYVVAPLAPTSFPIGGSGLTYGFEGFNVDGSQSELILQFATVVDDHFVTMVAAAYNEGGCPGRDDTSSFDSDTLAEVRPHLESVLIASPLPELGAS